MEIFTKLGIDWRLFLFQVVNFSILLFVLHRFLYKPLLGILEARRKKIEESMAQADAIARSQKEADERAAREVKHAQEKAKSIIEQAIDDAEKVKDGLVKKANDEAARLIERAKKEIGAECDKAMTEIKREAGDIAIAVAEKVLKEEITKERHERLIKETIA
ncbi:F0F1 ATP synthase subunit B [Candidatus Azambacteria bacterium]|nr:F0F1 ATP synthase subunit B [Candidatus Azambacteria bacterium]